MRAGCLHSEPRSQHRAPLPPKKLGSTALLSTEISAASWPAPASWDFAGLRQGRLTQSWDTSAAKVCRVQATFESQRQRVTVGELHQVQQGRPSDEQMGLIMRYYGKVLQGQAGPPRVTGAACYRVIGNWVGGWFSSLDALTKAKWVPAPPPPSSCGLLLPTPPPQYPCPCFVRLHIHQHPNPSSWG